VQFVVSGTYLYKILTLNLISINKLTAKSFKVLINLGLLYIFFNVNKIL
jgi:hypothetical protein